MAPDRKPGTEMQQAPGAWPLNARALLLVVTVIKRLFGRSGAPQESLEEGSKEENN